MKEILEYVKLWGINVDTIEDDGEISHIYWEYQDEYYCAVMPHSGNHYQYMLRVNPKETFDRWSIADEEYFYQTSQDMISYLKGRI